MQYGISERGPILPSLNRSSEKKMDKRDSLYYFLGGAALVVGGLVGLWLLRSRGILADPISYVNDLISRCDHRIGQIESDLSEVQAILPSSS